MAKLVLYTDSLIRIAERSAEDGDFYDARERLKTAAKKVARGMPCSIRYGAIKARLQDVEDRLEKSGLSEVDAIVLSARNALERNSFDKSKRLFRKAQELIRHGRESRHTYKQVKSMLDEARWRERERA